MESVVPAIWAVSFFTLFIGIFWISVYYLKKEKRETLDKGNLPSVTVLIPAYNEEKNIKSCLDSIFNLDYPKNKLKIIVINDGSTDDTPNIVKRYNGVTLINNKFNLGLKVASLNISLKKVDTDLFGCLDADSIVTKDSLKKMIHFFQNPKTGSVINSVMVRDPDNLLRKIQHLEYIFSNFSRRLMSKVDTLYVTPGVLSLYRTELIKKLGGFDEDNLTEDMEIAMRLKYNHYNVKIENRAFTYTVVPGDLKSHWRQRIRWFRGFIFNSKKYKVMFFNKEYGLMGTFQVPLNVISVALVVLMFILISYELIKNLYFWILKIVIYKFYILIDLPTLRELMMSVNLTVTIPVIVSFFVGIYIYNKAHVSVKEKWKYPLAIFLCLSIYPILRGLHWIFALIYESTGAKKIW